MRLALRQSFKLARSVGLVAHGVHDDPKSVGRRLNVPFMVLSAPGLPSPTSSASCVAVSFSGVSRWSLIGTFSPHHHHAEVDTSYDVSAPFAPENDPSLE